KEGAVGGDPGGAGEDGWVAVVGEHAVQRFWGGPEGLGVVPRGGGSGLPALFGVVAAGVAAVFDGVGQLVGRLVGGDVGVEDEWRSGWAFEQVELVVEGEVVEEPEAQDEVIARQVHLAYVLAYPGDAVVVRESFVARVDCGDLPAGISRPARVLTVPGTQIDEPAGLEGAQRTVEQIVPSRTPVPPLLLGRRGGFWGAAVVVGSGQLDL